MDPITLFGLAVLGTVIGAVIIMGTRMMYDYFKKRRINNGVLFVIPEANREVSEVV